MKPPVVPILRLNSMKVSSAVRSTARREPRAGVVFLFDLVGLDQASGDEEVAHRTGDVRLGLAGIVPLQNIGGGRGILGVVRVDVERHSYID